MKKLFKIISLLLIFAAMFSLCSCGEEKEQTPPDDDPITDEKVYADVLTFEIPDGSGTFFAESVNGYKYLMETGEKYVTLSDVKNELVFIRVSYHDGEDSLKLAPSYLDKNVKQFKNLEFPGTVQIGEDGLYAEMVAGFDDTQYAEAYLLDTEGGVLSLIISSSGNDSELVKLRSMVENFKIK